MAVRTVSMGASVSMGAAAHELSAPGISSANGGHSLKGNPRLKAQSAERSARICTRVGGEARPKREHVCDKSLKTSSSSRFTF